MGQSSWEGEKLGYSVAIDLSQQVFGQRVGTFQTKEEDVGGVCVWPQHRYLRGPPIGLL